jgi:hypothetical protein
LNAGQGTLHQLFRKDLKKKTNMVLIVMGNRFDFCVVDDYVIIMVDLQNDFISWYLQAATEEQKIHPGFTRRVTLGVFLTALSATLSSATVGLQKVQVLREFSS